jgi:DNA polymerase IV
VSEPRAILHVDMDAFFASVEQLDDPALRGRPVLVGHDGPRGVVAAASYEARPFGCHSAQPMAVAKRLCPHAAIVPGRFWRYREMSAAVFRVFGEFTPVIEPLSIDEAFLDVTGSVRVLGSPESMARRLKERVRAETGLTASVGVAPNKFLAKLASDMDKPDGLTIVRPEDVDRLLAPMPVGRIFGVGPKTAQRLEGIGIRTIGDLRRIALDVLRRRVGDAEAERYKALAHGLDDRPVVPDEQAKSIGQEQTFGVDLPHVGEVRDVLLEQTEQVAARLRKHGLRARTVTVKIRFGDFQTITRRCTLPQPTDTTTDLWQAARGQFDRWAQSSFQPVRLIGVAAGGLASAAGQMELFADPNAERQRRIDSAVDQINQRFGKSVIHRSSGE